MNKVVFMKFFKLFLTVGGFAISMALDKIGQDDLKATIAAEVAEQIAKQTSEKGA